MANYLPVHPASGERLPDFTLPDLSGRAFDISSIRGRWNLVLILAGEEDDASLVELLDEVDRRKAEFDFEDARVVFAVPPDSPNLAVLRRAAAFPVLLDEGARVHRLLNAFDPDGRPGLAVFVTDRYGEIYDAIRPGDASWPPGAETLLEWLRFVEIQCPE